jgi:hypothetical protein
MDFDAIHYARPDVFRLLVDERPAVSNRPISAVPE